MGLGFTFKEEEVEEEYVPLYRTIIECSVCEDKELYLIKEGTCSCGNLEIGLCESLSKVRHIAGSTWTHFKTVHYKTEEPKIYEILLGEETP